MDRIVVVDGSVVSTGKDEVLSDSLEADDDDGVLVTEGIDVTRRVVPFVILVKGEAVVD